MLRDLLIHVAALLSPLRPAPPPPPPPPPPPAPAVQAPAVSPQPAHEPPERTMRVESSAYCLRGRTASGTQAGPGQAASNELFGQTIRVVDGPLAGAVLEVTDRHAPRRRPLVDIWLPCVEARQYGRRTIAVAVES